MNNNSDSSYSSYGIPCNNPDDNSINHSSEEIPIPLKCEDCKSNFKIFYGTSLYVRCPKCNSIVSLVRDIERD